MTIQEFYENVRENYLRDITERYGAQKDNNGKEYLIVPIDSKDELLDRLEQEISDPWEEIEPFTDEEDKILFEKVKKEVLETYERYINIRKNFLTEHGMSEDDIFN